MDLAVIVVWLVLLAGVTLPAWYWAPPETFNNGQSAHGVQLGYFPNGPHGPGAWGLFVDTMPKALPPLPSSWCCSCCSTTCSC